MTEQRRVYKRPQPIERLEAPTGGEEERPVPESYARRPNAQTRPAYEPARPMHGIRKPGRRTRGFKEKAVAFAKHPMVQETAKFALDCAQDKQCRQKAMNAASTAYDVGKSIYKGFKSSGLSSGFSSKVKSGLTKGATSYLGSALKAAKMF